MAIWESAGTQPGGQVVSDAQGEYLIQDLPPGSYTVRTSPGKFQASLYPQLIAVSADGLRTQVDFQLTATPPPQLGSISGSVREAGLDHVSLGIRVGAYQFQSGQWVFQRAASVAPGGGAFLISDLPAGTYALATFGQSPRGLTYAHEVFQDFDCAADECSAGELSHGSPIALAAEQNVEGILIEVEPAASVSGCVLADGTLSPLPGVRVLLYKRTFTGFDFGIVRMAEAVTGANGCYRMDYVPQRPTESQFDSLARVRTQNTQGLVDRIYGGDVCRPRECDPMAGLPLAIPHDADIDAVDFVLAPGPALTGRVLATPTGGAIEGAVLWFYDANGVLVTDGVSAWTQNTGPDGRFHSTSLPPGTYHLVADVVSGPYQGRHLYGVPTRPGEPLPPTTSGTPLVVTVDSAPTSFDFVLDPEGVFRDGFESD